MTRAVVTTERRTPETKDSLSRGLTYRQRAFAEARARGFSLAKACRVAGYNPGSSASARAMGYQLSQDAQIAHLIAHLARSYLAAATGVASKVLVDVASDETVKPEHRVKAANSILARGGVPVSQDIDVSHSGTVEHRAGPTMSELRQRAGLPPIPERPALPPAGEVIDAEFEAVASFEDVEW